MQTEHDIVVVGAGVSGLTAAHALARRGHDVMLIDRRKAPGGRIRTERRDGFLVEHGPNSLVAPAPAAESLIDVLGLGPVRIERGPCVRSRYLVREGRAQALPLDALGFFRSRFFSLRARLRLGAEPFICPACEDETVADFVRRRFGRELLDYVFDPLVGGLYAGDPEALSANALFPQLKRMEREHGSILRGMLAAHRAGRGYRPGGRSLFSFRDGMATLPRRLAQSLQGRLWLDTRVETIEPSARGGFRVGVRRGNGRATLHAASVIVALPAYAAARALASLSADAAAALSGIAHPPLAVVALGYRAADIAHALDGFGVLAPKCELRGVLGMLFSSTLFDGRAPDGHALLTSYVGGARAPELARLPREDLEALARDEARDLLGATGAPVFSSVRYWPQALPQPGLGHARRIDALRRIEQQWPGLAVTGNYVAGVSSAACIAAALAAAGRIARYLSGGAGHTGTTEGTRHTVSLQA